MTTNPAFFPVQLPVNNVLAIQTTRKHPNNKQPINTCYQAFNLGLHVGDVREQVLANRQTLQEYLPDNSQIQWLEQIHSNQVVTVNKHQQSPPKADAIITQTPKLALAIMTADCLPVLLANKQGNEIAAIHCGWRPTLNQIIKHTIADMHSKPAELVAWLGPCIGPQVFEVGEEVRSQFIDISEQYSFAFKEVTLEMHDVNKKFKYLLDLKAIVKFQLMNLGVTNISSFDICTFSNNNNFYSYRREGKTGRMVSIICLC